MELKGQRPLPVDRATAWAALNDADSLKAAIPGCESFTETAAGEHEVVVNAAIGPIKARFKGKIVLADMVAPESYRIVFDLQGGAAGFSRGSAAVRLAESGPAACLMDYVVDAQVGGKIAQVGSRLVEAAAATMAERFFAAFAAQLAEKYPAPASGGDAAPVAAPVVPGFWATLFAFLRRLLGRDA